MAPDGDAEGETRDRFRDGLSVTYPLISGQEFLLEEYPDSVGHRYGAKVPVSSRVLLSSDPQLLHTVEAQLGTEGHHSRCRNRR